MQLNLEFVKKHATIFGGGLVGLLVLYFIFKAKGSTATGAGADVSGGANQVQALSAAADLTNAQTNAQITIAAYSAGVKDNQTKAALEATLADTAARLAATQQQTTAAEAVALSGQAAAVSMQYIVSASDVQKTALEVSGIEQLAATKSQTDIRLAQIRKNIAMAELSTIQDQVNQVFKRGDFSSNAPALATIIAEETGQGSTAPGIEAPLAYMQSQNSTGAQIGKAASGLTGILSALFG